MALPTVPVIPSDPPLFSIPPMYFPPGWIQNKCGDINGDRMVNQVDWQFYGEYMGWEECPLLDINENGVVDGMDFGVVIENLGRCLGDINNDELVNNIDLNLFNSYWNLHGSICQESVDFDPLFDRNCDGCINSSDQQIIINTWGQCPIQ